MFSRQKPHVQNVSPIDVGGLLSGSESLWFYGYTPFSDIPICAKWCCQTVQCHAWLFHWACMSYLRILNWGLSFQFLTTPPRHLLAWCLRTSLGKKWETLWIHSKSVVTNHVMMSVYNVPILSNARKLVLAKKKHTAVSFRFQDLNLNLWPLPACHCTIARRNLYKIGKPLNLTHQFAGASLLLSSNGSQEGCPLCIILVPWTSLNYLAGRLRATEGCAGPVSKWTGIHLQSICLYMYIYIHIYIYLFTHTL